MTIEIGVCIRGFKSFKDQGISIDKIKSINVIIGKNNSGKSSFLFGIGELCRSSHAFDTLKNTQITHAVSEELLKQAFSKYVSGTQVPGNHWYDHGQHLVDARITWERNPDGTKLKSISQNSNHPIHEGAYKLLEAQIQTIDSGLNTYQFRQINAERDIQKEPENNSLSLNPNGSGATSTIHSLLHFVGHDRKIIRETLLDALNAIFTPDINFNEITTRRDQNGGTWEVYLAEDGGEPYALSQSGSGLKTIILTLLNLHVTPIIDNKNINEYIFSFEELENNLHPSLQRSLYLYLEEFALENKCHIFLSTHSNIAIDTFCNSPNAQILHISRAPGESIGTTYGDTTHGYAILDDLGVRASDILQANGLIWVEGPSDRIYLNKFIQLWSDGALREGAHYQFALYGGSVLSNLDTSIPKEKFQEALSVFRVNKNFVFVCDSDKSNNKSRRKPRVDALIDSLSASKGTYWVTKCKEIENYIPKEAFEAVHSKSKLQQIGEYEYIQDYLKKNSISAASEYRDKHQKATAYSQYFTKENLKFRPEIDQQMKKICALIKNWNHLN